jgi:hypothetical protein
LIIALRQDERTDFGVVNYVLVGNDHRHKGFVIDLEREKEPGSGGHAIVI